MLQTQDTLNIDLRTGAKIPSIGLGTWQAPPGEVRNGVAMALKAGYRHIDCALIYGNETEVGAGIKDSGVPRKEIFITSKLWNAFHDNADESLRRSLKDLDTDYLDLYLVHWPVRLIPNDESELLPLNSDGTRAVDRDWDMSKTWAQMETMLASGKVKAIGVCNWSITYLEKLKNTWKVAPVVNQVELHPYLPQHELRDWCRKENIVMQAYSPLGGTGAPIAADKEIVKIAEKHNANPVNVLISYHCKQGVVALVKSTNADRLKANLRVLDLDEDDLMVLNKLDRLDGKHKRFNTPSFGSDLGFEDWYGKK